jgi:hypothetical protein
VPIAALCAAPAKVLLGLTAFVCVWAAAYWIWRSEREAVINLERAATVWDENKQQLLDHISSLEQLGTMRIGMERDVQAGKFGEQDWQVKFNALENEIATAIEQFASKAEATLYRHRGNLRRAISEKFGGLINERLVDICIHDLDHLRGFVQDHSRRKDQAG